MHRISAIIATAISRHAARMRSARMCWEKGVYSWVACCDPFYENQCWDNDYTYDRCCVPYEKKLQAPSPCDASATLPPTLLSRGASPLPFKGVSDREIMTSGGVFTAADASDVSAQCCWGATLPPHALGLGLPVLDAILAAETVSSYLEAYVLGSLRSVPGRHLPWEVDPGTEFQLAFFWSGGPGQSNFKFKLRSKFKV